MKEEQIRLGDLGQRLGGDFQNLLAFEFGDRNMHG